MANIYADKKMEDCPERGAYAPCERENTSWVYLFAPRSKVKSVNGKLAEAFPTYIHTSVIYKRKSKSVRGEERPTISGLVFVQGEERAVQALLDQTFYGMRLVRDCATGRTAVIGDKTMQPFIRSASINPTRIRFLSHAFSYYAEGNRMVRITSGVLEGLEGYLVRIARDRCLVTSLGGLTVSIGGVYKESFENMEETEEAPAAHSGMTTD